MKNLIQFSTFPVLLAMFALVTISCGDKTTSGKPANVDYYTCTMHPSVKSQDAKSKCPICGMELVPVMKHQSAAGQNPGPERGSGGVSERQSKEADSNARSDASNAPTLFLVPVERQQQIGVTYATIKKQPFALTLRAVGTVAYDKQRHWDYVARVDGYVQKLFVFSRGELAEKDGPLLTIYSPDLLTTENEFLDVLKTRDNLAPK